MDKAKRAVKIAPSFEINHQSNLSLVLSKIQGDLSGSRKKKTKGKKKKNRGSNWQLQHEARAEKGEWEELLPSSLSISHACVIINVASYNRKLQPPPRIISLSDKPS